jgi:anti-sigma B factor antagonist
VRDDVLVLAVSGQADLHTAPEVRALLTDALDDGRRRVVVDLTETTFIDSMMLGVLLGALKRVKGHSGQLAVACPDPSLRRVFEITSLDRVLDLPETVDDAIDVVRRDPDEG